MTTICMMMAALAAGPQFETFDAPGYGVPVCGAWYQPGEAASNMPLGGLGTGFIDFTPAGAFGETTVENNWLKPRPAFPDSLFSVGVGEKRIPLRRHSAPSSLRFWGHYPAADVDFGDTFPGASVYLRAFAPVIPHDADTSGLPAALFRFRAKNESGEKLPVEIALQWQQSSHHLLQADGNVEGALRWRRDMLRPQEIWTVAPGLRFFASKEERLKEFAPPGGRERKVRFSQTPEGRAYSASKIQDFLLDDLGGFSWETHRRQSALFAGAPNIGQVFWQLEYGPVRAGRGAKGGYGLLGDSVPATTADGRLEIDFDVISRADADLAVVFSIRNVSDKPVEDLSFAFSVNADIGGPRRAEKQEAGYVRRLRGILFSGGEDQPELLFHGQDADGCVVSTWPDGHRLAFDGQWESLNEAARLEAAVSSISDGVQINLPRGTMGVAARADEDDWTVKAFDLQNDLVKVVANKILTAGETSIVTFVVAWNFPEWTSSDGERLRHYYALKHADAGAVVAEVLPRAAELERRVVEWQEKIYASDTPGLLKDAAINSLYILPRNSWWIDDGRFFQSESFTGCPITETFVCRFNGSFPLALMWPELEKATMETIAKAQAESGEIPFGFGSPAGSRSPYFHVQHPIVSSEFVLTAWRNYEITGDRSFLLYDHAKKALRYAMTLDKDGDGLVNEDPGSEKGFPANQYYDIWPWWGTSAYTGSIWLAALRAGEEMAGLQGDAEFAQELRGWFERGRKSFEDKLWAGDYYRLYNDPAGKRKSDTILANGLCGQWFAYAAGLGEILPTDRVDAHISSVLRLNAKATKFGTVNGVTPGGKPDTTFPGHSAVLTIGETWNFCAMAAFAGREKEAVELFERSYENILLSQRTPWNIPWSLDPETGAIKWGINYYSNPCVWTLFQALEPEAYNSLAR